MHASWVIFALAVPPFIFVGCGEETTRAPEPERQDYSCRVCGEYVPIAQQRNESAEASGCLARTATPNGGVTCTVDNVVYDQLLIFYEGCETEPACPEGNGAINGEGGSSGLFGWDHECHICGDESDVDSAHDNGYEGAKCMDSGILPNAGERCSSGELSTVVGFNDCEGVPLCAAE